MCTSTISLAGHELTRIDAIRDLSILMDSSLRFDKHIDNITEKAATIYRMIFSSFTSRNQDILESAFCTYVRPILEYCSPVWNPIKSILSGLNVSRGDLPPWFLIHTWIDSDYLTYQLKRLLTSLCFKIRRGLLNWTASFSLLPSTCSTTLGHNFKLRTGKIRCETTKNFFCNRVVRTWNSLPADIVNLFFVLTQLSVNLA